MKDETIKALLGMHVGGMAATAYTASFFCKKLGLDKAELINYLRMCAELNSDKIADPTSKESINNAIETVAQTLEQIHEGLDATNTDGVRH